MDYGRVPIANDMSGRVPSPASTAHSDRGPETPRHLKLPLSKPKLFTRHSDGPLENLETESTLNTARSAAANAISPGSVIVQSSRIERSPTLNYIEKHSVSQRTSRRASQKSCGKMSVTDLTRKLGHITGNPFNEVTAVQLADSLFADPDIFLITDKESKDALNRGLGHLKRRVLEVFVQLETLVNKLTEQHELAIDGVLLHQDQLQDAARKDAESASLLTVDRFDLQQQNKELLQVIQDLKHSQVISRKAYEVKYNKLLESYHTVQDDFKECQNQLKEMSNEFTKTVSTKRGLLTDLELGKSQLERIGNLHKHLVANLESHMRKDGMLSPNKTQEATHPSDHESRVKTLKERFIKGQIDQTAIKLAMSMTEQQSHLPFKERIGIFVNQFLDLPGSTVIDDIEKMLQCDPTQEEGMNIKGAMASLNSHIEKLMTNVSDQILDVKLANIKAPPSSGTVPPTPRTQKERRTFKAGIRSELVENVAMLIADSLLNVHGRIKLPGVRQKGQVNDKTMIIGTSCKPDSEPSKSLWWRSDSQVRKENKSDATASSQEDERRLEDKWVEMDLHSMNKLTELKGPKHKARLTCVRGYTIDEKLAPLPLRAPTRTDGAMSSLWRSNTMLRLQTRTPGSRLAYHSVDFTD